jgi:hypothetical protein
MVHYNRLVLMLLVGLCGCCTFGDLQNFDLTAIDKYRDFLIHHDLNLDNLENHDRIAAFKHTIIFLESFSGEKGAYTTRLNHFADWTKDEIDSMFSATPAEGPDNTSMTSPTYSIMGSANLPVDINWASSSNPLGVSVLSGVHNQGSCGTTMVQTPHPVLTFVCFEQELVGPLSLLKLQKHPLQ